MGQHSGLLLVIVISWIIFLLTLIFNGLATTGQDGIFLNRTGYISDLYPTEATPASWTFAVWWIIYFFQAAWMLYLLTTILRQTPRGDYIYVEPGVIPWGALVFYSAANIATVVWLLLWDRQFLVPAFLVLSLVPFTLFLTAVLTTRALKQKCHDMVQQDLMADIWLNRLLVHNGVAIYATWTAIATLINLAIVLIYESPMQATNENASTAVLAILTFEFALWTVLDFTLFDEYTRYLITPYFVFFWAMAGITDTDHDIQSRNKVYSIILLVTAIIVFAFKIALLIYRSWKTPGEEAQPLNVRKSSCVAEK